MPCMLDVFIDYFKFFNKLGIKYLKCRLRKTYFLISH